MTHCRPMPAKKQCAHPGCVRTLYIRHRTYDVGFCQWHGGRVNGRANIIKAEPVTPAPARDGVRRVDVFRVHPPGGGMETPTVAVSLAKEPWA